MITLQELCRQFDQELKTADFQDYCPNGLQVEGKKEIKKAAFAVSANLETIDEAIAWGADALIVHHGLFWQKESPVIRSVKKEKIKKLLESDLSLLAYHLPLDAHQTLGNNWGAATDLGFKNQAPFSVGVLGEIDACSPSKFQEKLEGYYKHGAVWAPGGKSSIKTCAIVSGGAYKLIEEASERGVDAFVTGSFDEPVWHLAKELQVHFFALGHSATETVGPRKLAEWTKETLKIQTKFLDVENPF